MEFESNASNNCIKNIIAIKESLPKKQKQLCDYIIENFNELGLLTVKELADAAGVGTSTVLRVMETLGYPSFHDMRKDFHEVSVNTSVTKWRYVQESFQNKNIDNGGSGAITHVWTEVINLLDKSLSESLDENFQKTVELMVNCSRINILGLRVYKSIAFYLEHLIEEFYSKTRQLSFDSEALYDRILQFNKDEILIVFAFEPYTYRTLEAAEFCHKRGIPIVLITDHLSCPIVTCATTVLKVQASEKQFSAVPTIALLEALVVELGKRTAEVSIQKVELLDKTLKEQKITRS